MGEAVSMFVAVLGVLTVFFCALAILATIATTFVVLWSAVHDRDKKPRRMA